MASNIDSDGYVSFSGGQNEGRHPSLIAPTQTRKNINVTLKNGTVKPRPRFVELRDFTFIQKDLADKNVTVGTLTYRQNFYLGRRQHVGKYQTESGEYLVTVINGVIYLVNFQRMEVRVLPLSPLSQRPSLLNYQANRLNGHQAHLYYVIYDWPHQPVFISSDFSVRRTVARDAEIPRSYIGTYVHNRLFSANKGIEFGASDPVSPANNLAPITFLDSIVTDENPSPAYPDQFFSLSYIEKLSNITAMGYLQQTDGTSPLGFGPLMISTKEAIHLFPVNQPRDAWNITTAKSQFGSAYIFNYGIAGPRAFTNVGPDIWYRSYDGNVYSTATLYSDQRRWGNITLSEEIRDSLTTVNKSLIKFSSLGYFDNKIFVTLKPFLVRSLSLFNRGITDYAFNGLGVLELNNASGITSGNSNPVWAGIYAGHFTDMLEIDNQFIFTAKNAGRNIFLKYSPESRVDVISGIRSPVKTRIYTRQFNFGKNAVNKSISYIKLNIQNIVGKLTAKIYYKVNRSKSSDWIYYGSIYSDNCSDYASTEDEFIAKSDSAILNAKSVMFRIDIAAEDFEFLDMGLFAISGDEIEPKRTLDKPHEKCDIVDYTQKGDFDLWN